MCPYFNEQYGKCLLYKTYPREYDKRRWCMECDSPYKECPNYKEAERRGNLQPPYMYK